MVIVYLFIKTIISSRKPLTTTCPASLQNKNYEIQRNMFWPTKKSKAKNCKSSSNQKTLFENSSSQPKRLKTKIACSHCQTSHLTCDESKNNKNKYL